MGALSRMIAGHKGKGGTRGRKIMEFCLLVCNMEDRLVGRGEGFCRGGWGLKVGVRGPGAVQVRLGHICTKRLGHIMITKLAEKIICNFNTRAGSCWVIGLSRCQKWLHLS